jgi:hypothetical protein
MPDVDIRILQSCKVAVAAGGKLLLFRRLNVRRDYINKILAIG